MKRASLIIIGDEILSGRTEDKNLVYLAKWLGKLGISLSEVRVVLDDEEAIIGAVNSLRKKYDYVFTTGGICPTHDDITTESIAKAFGVESRIDDGALEKMQAFLEGKELTEPLLKMLRIPEGGELIYSPVTKAPGYKIENVFVMAGVPSIFRAMTDSTIPQLVGGDPLLSISVRIEKGEGDIATKLSEIAKNHKEVSIGSYPFSQNGRYGTMIVARHKDKDVLNKSEKKLQNLM